MVEGSRIVPIDIGVELRNSYLAYAMRVNVHRAIPDVRDGLKPVHRRILFAMYEAGMTSDKPYKKSARVVGDVLGKYHPHGDVSVYDALVILAQEFATRYMLVDGQGNFGSVDGDSAAAMRYTEARMSKIAFEMLRDINKETVDFGPNYDEKEKEPRVLPARFPNLLVNGSIGIGVGMATNIPPHNLREVIDGILLMIENAEVTNEDLMTVIKGPDFPTGALILGREGIRRAYTTGYGSVMMRGVTQIEEGTNGKARIVITEIPYKVNKARLVEKIYELARDKRLDGITDLRDESDRTGMRVVIELRRDVKPQVMLNNLYKFTQLQASFNVINLALVNGEPKVLDLRSTLYHYLEHQKDVVVRRTKYDLRRAQARAHILEGLRIALDHIDAIIELIRSSKTTDEARGRLIEGFSLSEEQAQAILEMRLQRLTGLERDKIEAEYQELIQEIARLQAILNDPQKVLNVIREEIVEVRAKYGDERRTRIVAAEGEIDLADLIPVQEVVITITHDGYVKRLPVVTYRSQKRGGRGVTAMGTKDEDFVEHLFITSSHNTLLFFSNRGKVYQIKAYEIPEFGRAARGVPIINLLNIEQGEQISAVIPIKEFTPGSYLFMATRNGVVKKTGVEDFANIRKGGIIALGLREDDELIGVKLTDGNRDIVMGTRLGMSIRFPETDVRTMGRTATGVKGIRLDDNDVCVGMDMVREDTQVLVVTSRGHGKRTNIGEYRAQTRGGKGIKTLNVTSKNGHIVALRIVDPDEDLMIITTNGMVIRMHVQGISLLGRYTQGVKLIGVRNDDEVSTVARVASDEDNIIDEELELDAGTEE